MSVIRLFLRHSSYGRLRISVVKKIPPSPPFAKGGVRNPTHPPIFASPFAKGGLRGIFLLLLLFALPLWATPSNTAQPRDPLDPKQQQENPKPILDAPSLRIPAAPAYQTTLKELGYKDVDDLLKQTLQVSSLSVAFDGGGSIGLRLV
jgi:hypothetical protein